MIDWKGEFVCAAVFVLLAWITYGVVMGLYSVISFIIKVFT